jgi:hypothetical protein
MLRAARSARRYRGIPEPCRCFSLAGFPCPLERRQRRKFPGVALCRARPLAKGAVDCHLAAANWPRWLRTLDGPSTELAPLVRCGAISFGTLGASNGRDGGRDYQDPPLKLGLARPAGPLFWARSPMINCPHDRAARSRKMLR